MADKELGSLTSATTLDGTETHYVVQGGNSRKTTGAAIVAITHNQAWSTITSTPTTLSGYGITDAQPLDSDLTAIAGLTTTGFGRGFLEFADEAAFKAGVNLEIGTDVQAHDALLDAIAALTTASGDIVYATGADAVAALGIGVSGQVLKVGATGLPEWGAAAGGGDMLASVYDPTSVSGDAFDMANMAEATDAKIMTAEERTKLAGIEAGADVTDATNVDAAGATMNTDTDVSANSWVLDEDDMASDSAAKVPTQQSVKAYADTKGALSGGNTWTGVQDFQGNQIKITGAAPAQDFVQTDGPDYRWQLNGNSMTLLADPDDNGSFDTTALNINAATQTVSVFGADLKALNDDGGFNLVLAAATQTIDGAFGGGPWVSGHRIEYTDTGTFSGSKATTAIMRYVEGSGANGPGHAGYALNVETIKTDYLTSAVLGEIDGMMINVRQGEMGDSGAILINHSHVESASYGAVGIEQTLDWVQATTGTVLRSVHSTMGSHLPSTDVRQNGVGFSTRADTGACETGFLVFDSGGTWSYAFRAASSLSLDDVYFGVEGPGFGSGNEGTLWGGWKVAFVNSSAAAETGYTLSNVGLASFSRDGGQALDLRRLTSDGSIAIFRRGVTNVGSVSVTATATAYNTSSDENLKSFVGEYDPLRAIDIIRRDPVREFDWKSTGERAVGWGAQTSYAVSPDLATPPTNDNEYWSLDQSRRTPYLWAATRWALDQIDDHETRIANLEERLAA